VRTWITNSLGGHPDGPVDPSGPASQGSTLHGVENEAPIAAGRRAVFDTLEAIAARSIVASLTSSLTDHTLAAVLDDTLEGELGGST
jgi:hypothetical protein